LRESLVIRHKADGQLAGHCFVFVALRELALSKTLPPQPKAKPEVDEDWGQASIFINLAYRRYLKTVERIPLSPPQSRRTACWPLFCFCGVAGACSQKRLPPQPKAKPEVDEDWGRASIFINLAYRRYLKIVEENPSLSATKQTDSLLAVVLFL